jgi:hypothetical protein
MGRRVASLMHNRAWRHITFWVCWVVGFTFIKSFGQAYEVYFGWFSYYIVTLPIFVAHTYLVAYVLVPRFLTKRFIPLFILLFLALFYGFSVLELLLSNEFIFKWYPTSSTPTENYLVPGNVITSGLGNLYIVLVFLAARTIRNWYLADHKRKELQQVELQQQMEDAMNKVQPMMLLYAIDHIEQMVERSSPGVTNAIAKTSELLSEVMMQHEEKQQMFIREIELVRKLVSLVELFRGTRPEVEFFISGDPGHIKLPPMILFSFVDLIFRRFNDEPTLPELSIEASGFSNMVTIQVLQDGIRHQDGDLEECMKAIQKLEQCYAGQVSISYQPHNYGCSVIIRNEENSGVKTTHMLSDAVDMAKTAGN